MAVGTGFAVLETLGYGFVTLLLSGDLAVTEVTLLLRGVLSPAAQVGAFVLVVALHTMWDTFPDWPTFVIVGMISLVLLIRQTHRDVLPTEQPTAG